MTRKDVFLLLLILSLGFFLTFGQKVRRGFRPFSIQVDGLDLLKEPLHTIPETGRSRLSPGDRLEIEAGRGHVEVVTWKEPEVRVEVQKHVRAAEEQEAARIAADLILRMEPSPGLLRVSVVSRAGTIRPEGVSTDFIIRAPADISLSVTTSHGEIQVHGIRRSALLRTSHADVEAGDIGGDCRVENRHGGVTLSRVRGNAEVRTEHDDVKATEIGGSVVVESAHGDVEIADVGGTVQIRTKHGEVKVEKARGNVKVEAPHSAISLAEVEGAVSVTAEADPLEIRDVKGPADVRADVTSVRLEDVQGTIKVAGRHTDVSILRPGGDVLVETTNQEIMLSPPSARGFRLQASADQGEIESTLPGLRIPDTVAGHFSGVVGDGRSRYILSAPHGSIRIEPSR